MSVTLELLMDQNWFIKQNTRINLGCEGESPLHVLIHGYSDFSSSFNYVLDIGDDTVALAIDDEDSKLLVVDIPYYVFSGKGTKAIQVRANNTFESKYSNIVYGYVSPSVNGDSYSDGLPTEFVQFEQKLRDIINGAETQFGARVSAVENRASQLETWSAATQTWVNSVQSWMTQTQEWVEETQETIVNHEARIAALESWKTVADGDIAALQTDLDSAEVTIGTHTNTLANHETRIAALETTP